MLQSASQTTNNAKRAVVAATTTATAMIVPIVIVQTPVCDRLGLDGEVVGKRARILIRQITIGCASSPPALAHRDDPSRVQLRPRVGFLGADNAAHQVRPTTLSEFPNAAELEV
jgi:hypothetical protein